MEGLRKPPMIWSELMCDLAMISAQGPGAQSQTEANTHDYFFVYL